MPHRARSATLVDPGALLAATHELDDGTRVRLRLARPSDAALVADFLDRLPAGATEATVRDLTFFDPRKRLTMAATMPLDGTERIVGVAEMAYLAGERAEIGLLVDEAHRRRGLGKLLSEAVTSLAIQRGTTPHVRLRADRRRAAA